MAEIGLDGGGAAAEIPQAATPTDASPPADPQPATAARLYTRCPRCKTAYRITVAQLRQGRGTAQCQACAEAFSALGALAETPARAIPSPATHQPPMLGQLDAVVKQAASPLPASDSALSPKPPDQAHRGGVWGIGAGALLALLAAQIGCYAWPQLAQNPSLRLGLEAACATLNCRLPPFRAPGHIKILGHTLAPNPGGLVGYEFSLILANQAPLPQAFPAIKLVLADYNGNPAAARIFQPAEYLPDPSPILMPVGQLYEIHLLLAMPQQVIGGFSFELI